MSDTALESRALPAVAAAPPLSFTLRLRKRGLNPTLLAGLILIGIVILVAIFAPLLTPYDPIAQNLDDAFLPPLSPGHALGTDNFGRDIWSRIAYSTRLDLQIGLISVLFPFIFGSLIGITTGYLGGRVDSAVMRVVDVLMAFPFLVLVVAVMSILGPGISNLYIALASSAGSPTRASCAPRRSRRAIWNTSRRRAPSAAPRRGSWCAIFCPT